MTKTKFEGKMMPRVCPISFQLGDTLEHFVSLKRVEFKGETKDSFKDKEGKWHNHSKNYVKYIYRCICGNYSEVIRVNVCICGWVYAEGEEK